MKTISFISPFCDLIKNFTSVSILDKAEKKKIVKYEYYNLFDFSDDSNSRIDDSPYGGGDGMVLRAKPIFNAFDKVKKNKSKNSFRVIYPTPDGQKLDLNLSKKLALEDNIVFICGHYKGIDQRVRDTIVTDEISIGDYILTGGELPSCIIIDSIVRLIPGVLNSIESAETDSFNDGLLDTDYYTRPDDINGLKVPEVLVSGNHKEIEKWREERKIEKTKLKRSDLYINYIKNKKK